MSAAYPGWKREMGARNLSQLLRFVHLFPPLPHPFPMGTSCPSVESGTEERKRRKKRVSQL